MIAYCQMESLIFCYICQTHYKIDVDMCIKYADFNFTNTLISVAATNIYNYVYT